MSFDLSDRIYLITGAGRGLGRASAELLARYGARVGIADLDAITARETTEAIRRAGGVAHALVGDAGARATFLNLAAELAARYGRIDGIVNAAMWIRYDAVRDVNEEVLDRMLSVGLKAPLWARCRADSGRASRGR